MSEFVFFFFFSCIWSINTDYTLIRARKSTAWLTYTDKSYKTRAPPLTHLPCLPKSSFSPRFSPIISFFPPSSCSAQTEETSSSLQPCAATAIQLPMHRTWDFYPTIHYSAHYMQRAIPIQERTPCRKLLHRSLNFYSFTLLLWQRWLFLFLSLRNNIIILTLLTGQSEDFGFLEETKSLTALSRRSDNSDSI